MPETYRHTQIGYWSLFLLAPWSVAVLAMLIWGNPAPGMDILFGLIALFCTVLALFLYGMTITVDDTHISWHYGLGSFRKKVALEKILDVRVVEHLNMGGLGSRHTSKGMQYAVSFGSGIELEIKTPWKKNKIVILGSNEPDVLREVLIAKIQSRVKLLGGEMPESLSLEEEPETIPIAPRTRVPNRDYEPPSRTE